ncbi:MAG: nitrate reductase [Firmicutes bacterium]|nr:nitrate reductase [Bacillota bacterium]
MKRIMIDADNCKGCRNCAIACMQSHRKNNGGSLYDLDLTDPANESRNLILLNAKNKFVPLFCRHCDHPECVSSCMSGALEKDPCTGLVKYDAEKCAACFMCVMSCPYGVIKPDTVTKTKVIRCDFCKENGGEPSCVKVCRGDAIYIKEV